MKGLYVAMLGLLFAGCAESQQITSSNQQPGYNTYQGSAVSATAQNSAATTSVQSSKEALSKKPEVVELK